MRSKLVPAIFASLLSSMPAAAQQLPIADGAYVTDEECDKAEAGELDMVRFTVEKAGRSVSLEEAGCLVGEIKQMRARRYAVSLDCIEFGEPYQYDFFLDVLSDTKIRIDGDDLRLCNKGFLAAYGANTPSSKTDDLIEKWYGFNDNCRGGFGDDPATMKACRARDSVSDELAGAGYCFGREDQSASEYRWHKCQAGSIHE